MLRACLCEVPITRNVPQRYRFRYVVKFLSRYIGFVKWDTRRQDEHHSLNWALIKQHVHQLHLVFICKDYKDYVSDDLDS